MASNSLVANPQKTGFFIIRSRRACNSSIREISVGNSKVKEEEKHRILGIVVNNTLTWNDHVNDGLMRSVNMRIGGLRRISHHVPTKYLPEIASAIVASKIRYGISVYGAVRLRETDPKPGIYQELQVALNNAMRIASGVRLSDRVSIERLSNVTKIKTLNHMAAEDMMMLVWKGLNDPSSPLSGVFSTGAEVTSKMTRAKTRGDLRSEAMTNLTQRNFPHTCIELWNNVDVSIRDCKTKFVAKQKIREISGLLPL
mgnify:CR=1 FL=1